MSLLYILLGIAVAGVYWQFGWLPASLTVVAFLLGWGAGRVSLWHEIERLGYSLKYVTQNSGRRVLSLGRNIAQGLPPQV